MSYFIVFFQLATLKIFGLEISQSFAWFIWADPSNVSYPITIAACGLLAYILGTTVPSRSRSFHQERTAPRRRLHVTTVKILTILAFASYVLFLLTAGSYVSGAYARDASPISAYFIRFFNIFMFSALCIELHRILRCGLLDLSLVKYCRQFYRPLTLLLVTHLAMSFLVGDRGPIIAYLILFTSVFYQILFDWI